VPTELILPVTLPTKLAVIVPAEKSPLLSLATTFPIMFEELASTDQVVATEPSKFAPVKYVPFVKIFVVLDLTVTSF